MKGLLRKLELLIFGDGTGRSELEFELFGGELIA